MVTSARPVALFVAATLAVAMLTVGTAPVAAQSETSSCSTTILYDEFRHDNGTVDKLSNSSSATVTKRNTRVTVEESDAFYRITGENPNGYCVQYTVEIAHSAMPAADLSGEVTATDGNQTASWDAIYDWNSSQTYTTVTFTLGPGETATFAPNQMRVFALSWATEKATKATGIIGRLRKSVTDDEPVTKRKYRVNVSEDDESVKVPLKHPQTNEELEGWQAMYRVGDDDGWRPLSTDSQSPVYQEVVDNGSAVVFHFNDADADVRFTANPNALDKADYQLDAYLSGIPDLSDLFGGDES